MVRCGFPCIPVLFLVLCSLSQALGDPVRIFILAGQSNMEGADTRAADVDRFPPFVGVAAPQDDVLYSYRVGRHASDGWVKLQPVDGRFGPELTFARKVKAAAPGPIAIIKSAVGGTTLARDWNPDGPDDGRKLFASTIELVRRSVMELERRDIDYTLEAVLWHQGENDMLNMELARGYGSRLERFVASVREKLGDPQLKFFIGEISDKGIWGMDHRRNMRVLRREQLAAVGRSAPHVHWVPTSHLAFEVMGSGQPHYHFGTLGQLQHGEAYADAYLHVIGKAPRPAPAGFGGALPVPSGKTVRVFVVAGGRNAEGEGAYVARLAGVAPQLGREQRDVLFRYSLGGGAQESADWGPLRPIGFLGNFGPEVSLGQTLAKTLDDPVAVIKITDSASVMLDWLPDPEDANRPMYDRALSQIRQALDDLDARGVAASLEAVLWIHGEHDAYFPPYRPKYAGRLRALMDRLRSDLGVPRLRWIVAAQSNRGPWGGERIEAMNENLRSMTDSDPLSWLVGTSGLPHARIHFDTLGTVLLGRELARAWLAVAGHGGGGLPAADGATSLAERTASWVHHQRLERESPFRELQWRAVGPRMQGGRIECIAVDPTRPTTLYVGAGAGNLWKSVNNGITWKPIFEKQSTFAMGDVAVAPSAPNTIWLGTGEVLMARSSYAGTGVFKSTDGGETWTNVGLRDTHHIGRVVVDPVDADVVHVAAIGHLYTRNEERGVFKTTDGGENWRKVLFVDDRTGAIDLVMHPRERSTLFATLWQRERRAWGHLAYGEGSGLYRSTDAGETWKRLTNGFPVGPHVGRIGVDIARSDPRVVYAVTDCEGDAEGLYRSDDGGDTWRKVNRERISAGYDFCMVRVAPDDADDVWVVGVRNFRSVDGGETFQQVLGTLVHLLPHDSRVLHLDTHSFLFEPRNPDRILLGNDGGLHMSYDRGASWLHLNNLPIGEFYAVWADDGDPYTVYAGTQDNAALYGPTTHDVADGEPDPWRHVYLDRWGGGDSYFTYPDPSDPQTIYYAHQFGDLRRKDMRSGESKRIRPRAGPGMPKLRFNWMTPFIISRFGERTLYCGANRVFRSTDRGDTWTAISADLTTQPGPEEQGNIPYGTITALAEGRRQGLIYAGTDDGTVHVTGDGGEKWTRIDAGLPDRWVSRVEPSWHEDHTVHVTFTGYREDDFSTHVYRSRNGGRRWQPLAANLPAESVNVIREDPDDRNVLYLGTDLGVYVSLDRGERWHSLCATLPTTPVHDLFVHRRARELIAGTHGRSVFVLDLKPIDTARAAENRGVPDR